MSDNNYCEICGYSGDLTGHSCPVSAVDGYRQREEEDRQRREDFDHSRHDEIVSDNLLHGAVVFKRTEEGTYLRREDGSSKFIPFNNPDKYINDCNNTAWADSHEY